MNRRLSVLLVIIVAAAGFGVWVYQQPFLVFSSIKEAAQKGDRPTLDKHIDFVALRESVKDNIRRSLGEKLRVPTGSPLAGLGRMLVNAALDPVVEKLVSPEGIAALAEGIRPAPPQDDPGAGGNGRQTSADRARADESRPRAELKSGYDSIDRYTLRYIAPEDGRERVTLIMSRQGLFTWRLTGVRFAN